MFVVRFRSVYKYPHIAELDGAFVTLLMVPSNRDIAVLMGRFFNSFRTIQDQSYQTSASISVWRSWFDVRRDLGQIIVRVIVWWGPSYKLNTRVSPTYPLSVLLANPDHECPAMSSELAQLIEYGNDM